MGIKWFARRDWEGKVISVFKSEWDGDTLSSESVWSRADKEWSPTNAVSYWFFNGDNTIEPITDAEAGKLLPTNA